VRNKNPCVPIVPVRVDATIANYPIGRQAAVRWSSRYGSAGLTAICDDTIVAALTVRAKRPVHAETVCARPLLLWRRVVGLTGGSDGGCASGVGLFERFRNGLSRT
jgi:hypothetical protein